MSERLLTISETARRLGMSRTHLYRVMPQLYARGLQRVAIGGRTRVREVSLDLLIKESAEHEQPLVSSCERRRFKR